MTAWFTPLRADAASVRLVAATAFDAEAGDLYSADGHVINPTAAQAQKEAQVQSNEVTGWPEGPAITAGSAVLMDADTGILLYAKNIHERMYPASTTKLLTSLIAAENLDLQDTVTFSYEAIHSVPSDGSNAGMDVGETITVEQCLYATLVGSANECANALAEKVAGSVEAFTDLMNARAAQLGCVDSHFANANGLYDDDHYTSAYDLCLIGRAFLANDICQVIGNTARYHFEATATQPDDFWLTNKHALINQTYAYEGILGGKTGYTSQSHETLVTGCYRSGMRLICVVMKEDDPAQFLDTITLFDYGFDNFTLMNIADSDLVHRVQTPDFFRLGNDLMGSKVPALAIYPESSAVVPNTVAFEDLDCEIGADNIITYSFGGQVVGRAALIPAGMILPVSGDTDSAMTEGSADNSGALTASPSGNAGGTASAPSAPTGNEYNAGALSEESSTDPKGESLPERLRAVFETTVRPLTDRFMQTGLNGTVYINVRALTVMIIAFVAALLILITVIGLLWSFSFNIVDRQGRAPRGRARRKQASKRRSDSGVKSTARRTAVSDSRAYREGKTSRYHSVPEYEFTPPDPDFTGRAAHYNRLVSEYDRYAEFDDLDEILYDDPDEYEEEADYRDDEYDGFDPDPVGNGYDPREPYDDRDDDWAF